MNVEEIKKGLATLSEPEQAEITAFLFHLRHVHDSGYQSEVAARISDRDESHWLTPGEFEKRLDQQ